MKKSIFWVVVVTIFFLCTHISANIANAFDEITLKDLEKLELSPDVINGSDSADNQIPVGTVLVYKTNESRFGKMVILEYGYNLAAKWVTYNSDGSIFSQGQKLLIKGTWDYDMDYGTESTNSESSPDFWWEQVDEVTRYIVPQNGSLFTLYTRVLPTKNFDDITVDDIKQRNLTPDKIDGSDNKSSKIFAGTILIYQTDEGRYGKMKVLNYGYNLSIQWVTYNTNGSIFRAGDDLLIKGTWTYDMDYGTESKNSKSSPDFWWEQVDETIRFLVPQSNARFSVF